MIQGVAEIRNAYRDERVAKGYVGARFQQPLGALLHARQADALKRTLRQHQPEAVLEIAPGPARLTTEVAAVFDRPITIVDASVQMLQEAVRRLELGGRGRWRPLQGDAFQLPVTASFDLVYSFRFVRHFEALDRGRIYAQVARVLRPDGLFVFDAVNEVVSAPLRAAAPHEYAHYDALLTPETLRQEVEAAGLRLVSLEPVQRRVTMLRQIQVLIAPRSTTIARGLMEVVDRCGGGEPLEWIVTCRRE
jgi:ubiquinone/menaquinone biosynthesis C-methylase UbiE